MLHVIFCLLVLSEVTVSIDPKKIILEEGFQLQAILRNILPNNIPKEGFLNFSEVTLRYGRRSEEFDIVTEDGYILKLFHITGNESKKPVLLMHGLEDSADSFVIRGNISIGLNLIAAGYDVWAGNVRGNKYSRQNVKLSPDVNKKDFWDFSFHEMAIYDLPAIIDFILDKTGKDKLSVIGHSQGNTICYALGSVKPEYNEKISVYIVLAPVSYLTYAGPGFTTFTTLPLVLKGLFDILSIQELFGVNSTETKLIQSVCTQGQLSYELCLNIICNFLFGPDPDQLEREFFVPLLGHFPAGASAKAFRHYGQIRTSGRFAQYDYGVVKNLLVYKSVSSPVYDLSRVTMPVALVAAKNDAISSLKDVERLRRELPNVVFYHVLERELFNHVDYIWARQLDVLLNPLLRDLLVKFA